MPKLSAIVARNFQSLRRKLGGTQEEFAEVSGLSQSAISRLENRSSWKQLDRVSHHIEEAGGDPLDLLQVDGVVADKRIARIRKLLMLADSSTLSIILALLERNTAEGRQSAAGVR